LRLCGCTGGKSVISGVISELALVEEHLGKNHGTKTVRPKGEATKAKAFRYNPERKKKRM